MTLYFSSDTRDVYTCEFRSSPIDVARAQAVGNGQDAVIGTVLDTYANQFYGNILAPESPGEAGVVISKTGNQIYGVTALVMVAAFVAFLAWAILCFRDIPVPEKLKGTGKAIALACVFAFIICVLIPVLIKSFLGARLQKAAPTTSRTCLSRLPRARCRDITVCGRCGTCRRGRV